MEPQGWRLERDLLDLLSSLARFSSTCSHFSLVLFCTVFCKLNTCYINTQVLITSEIRYELRTKGEITCSDASVASMDFNTAYFACISRKTAQLVDRRTVRCKVNFSSTCIPWLDACQYGVYTIRYTAEQT